MKKKLPTPQKLPSGAWRCQVMVDGKRVSVVENDPVLAQAKAVSLKAGLTQKTKPVKNLTLGEAIDRYIESKDSVLSPGTIRGYRKIRRTNFEDIIDTKIGDLTQESIQRSVNSMAKTISPKSIRNAHGLLSATLGVYRPEMVLKTTLPQKIKYDVKIPTDEEIKTLAAMTKGTEMELPFLLAAWVGMRQSEIRGLTWDSLNGNVLHIKAAVVDGDDGPKKKDTKTYSGDRKIILPNYIVQLINAQPKKDEYIIHLSGEAMYARFSQLCKKAGIQHYRFHDLRHYNASVMLALGVPDKYAMERMGHATNHMLKTVYQHTMSKTRQQVDSKIDDYFFHKMHTSLHTEK